MTAAFLLQLVAEGAPIALRIIEDARKGKLPTDADWMELEILGKYLSTDAMKNNPRD